MIEGKTVDGEASEEQVVEDALAVEDKSGSEGCIMLASPWEEG